MAGSTFYCRGTQITQTISYLALKGQNLALYCIAIAGARFAVSSFSILWLIRRPANSAATRIAFLMALALDDPWVMKHTPFTPSKGAPPYSVWSRRFLKSAKALRESQYPTCRVMVVR